MGRIGSHFALLPLAVPGSAFQGVYPGTAFAFSTIPAYSNLGSQRKSELRFSMIGMSHGDDGYGGGYT